MKYFCFEERKSRKIYYTSTITIIMRVCRACLVPLNEPTDAVNILDELYKNQDLSILLLDLFNFKVNSEFECKLSERPV